VRGKVEYTLSSGNVFADLGLPDAEELLATNEEPGRLGRALFEAARS